MDKTQIAKIIEDFAPLQLAEKWDCSGWGVNLSGHDKIFKAMICLTVTDRVVQQAIKQNCDIIISHHPLFFVPFEWKSINIYSAHTNLDRTKGGTTDTLINKLFGNEVNISGEDFVRYVDCEISAEDLLSKLQTVSPNLRYVNNNGVSKIRKIAFCAGSGSEFIEEAFENGAEVFVTGDVKFHTAVDSKLFLVDVGHFESEKPVLEVFERLLSGCLEVVYAEEKTPFQILTSKF